MQTIVFSQRARIGHTLFVLRGRTLEVDGPTQRRVGPVSIDVKELSTKVRTDFIRPMTIIGGLVFVAVVLLDIARRLLQTGEMVGILAMYPAMFGFMLLLSAVRLFPRSERLTFAWGNQGGVLVFIREKEQAQELDTFVAELMRRIRLLQDGAEEADLEAGAPSFAAEPLSAAKYSTGTESLRVNPYSNVWKAAFAGGAIAMGTPLLVLDRPELHGVVFMVSFPATVVGLYTAIVSWRRKERFRAWAVAGAILATAPFFLFSGWR